ncbi:MAG TPA: hypothetical protein PKY10_09025, partial [Lentisphaeria bacterium]|nr:hypothetical protein [Lentisphaeria bacterium]
ALLKDSDVLIFDDSLSAVQVLEARDRCQAAESAPAAGLFLAKVFWTPEEWKTYQPLIPPFAL